MKRKGGVNYLTVVSPFTSKTWLDRNLGATRVCKAKNDMACYGDYYQWGRDADGHQEANSTTSSTKAGDINSAGDKFITSSGDWTTADANGSLRAANWTKRDGSSICPTGFRVPSLAEIEAETTGASTPVTNNATAYSNFLKLPVAKYRNSISGGFASDVGLVWSSSIHSSVQAGYLAFSRAQAELTNQTRAFGASIRCIKH